MTRGPSALARLAACSLFGAISPRPEGGRAADRPRELVCSRLFGCENPGRFRAMSYSFARRLFALPILWILASSPVQAQQSTWSFNPKDGSTVTFNSTTPITFAAAQTQSPQYISGSVGASCSDSGVLLTLDPKQRVVQGQQWGHQVDGRDHNDQRSPIREHHHGQCVCD